jgi:hypothetical protein
MIETRRTRPALGARAADVWKPALALAMMRNTTLVHPATSHQPPRLTAIISLDLAIALIAGVVFCSET